MKSIINLMLLLLIVSKACNYGFADDAVGVLRVDVGTNDIAEVEMPLAPLSCFGPSSYLSGLFLGNSSVRSDYLFRYDCDTHELTNAYWNGASWIDPATESDSSMMHVPGDAFCHIPHDFGENAPRGFSPGVFASYFILNGALSNLPDFSGFQPDFTGMVSRIYFPRSLTAWTGAPDVAIDRFGAVFEGALLIRTEGMYEIFLASDDGARLYMDGKLIVDNNGNHSMTERSSSLPLSAGLHSIRIEYYDNEGSAGLELSWRRPDGFVETIPEFSFFHAEGIVDADSDGMPDWWEEKYTLDMLDPADAELDNDLDGLSNLEEFRNGSNPNIGDSDGDGMPDQWEAINGTCAFLADALGDLDGDGFINIEEYRYKTDPKLSDTDGDGYTDGDERHLYFSDPAKSDFSKEVATNAVFDTSSIDIANGEWLLKEHSAVLLNRSGAIIYTNDLFLSEAGLRQIRLPCLFSGRLDAVLVCRVDGERVGSVVLSASDSPYSTEACFLTSWMQAGIHELAFELQNFSNDASFECSEVAICEVLGADSDGNGVADWLDTRIRLSSTLRSGVVHSKVSPYCMRGVYSSHILPKVFLCSHELDVHLLPYHGWWANMPLNSHNGTSASIIYENGMKQESVTVQWVEFDVTTEQDIVIRKGDSLLLSLGGHCGAIDVNGNTVSSNGAALAYCFTECGEYTISGRYAESSRLVSVKVVDCSLSSAIPVWRGKINSFSMDGAGFETMAISWSQDAKLASLSVSETRGTCSLEISSLGNPVAFACEIPNPDASIVSSARLQPFSAYYTLDGVFHISHRIDEDTVVVRNRLSVFDLPDGVELRMTGNSGICFEDGSGKLILTSNDFDDAGDCIYHFLVPAGVSNPCQFLHAYFNGKEFAQ